MMCPHSHSLLRFIARGAPSNSSFQNCAPAHEAGAFLELTFRQGMKLEADCLLRSFGLEFVR